MPRPHVREGGREVYMQVVIHKFTEIYMQGVAHKLLSVYK